MSAALIIFPLVLIPAAEVSADGASEKWSRFVKTEGQDEPVPEVWLQDKEARIAHSLKLPDAAKKTVPFDFSKAAWTSWIPGKPSVAVQYFNHLCGSEAGEWIFRKVERVEGFYFARPQGAPNTEMMTRRYEAEMPWMQRTFIYIGDSLHWEGSLFIQPPFYNYRYVEQPHRDVSWQKWIDEPYVRLFGYTQERMTEPNGKLSEFYRDKTPMQVIGVPMLSAKYGYTWRGIKRPRDRELNIAGGEILIYDLQTRAVLAVRRQFLISIGSRNTENNGVNWEVAASCARSPRLPSFEFKQFAFDVLQTIEPSTVQGS
jgi:hypothetical protein